MAAIAYIRVSTSGQADQGVSLSSQEAKIRSWAELHDHDIVAVHEDAGPMGHQGAVRFSPGTFTDDEDVETAIEAVMDAAEFATKHRVAASR